MKLIKGALLGSDFISQSLTQYITLQTSISYFLLLLFFIRFIQTVHFFLKKKTMNLVTLFPSTQSK